MVRKSDVILLGLLVGLFLVVASWPYLSYSSDASTGAVTGNAIREAIGTFYETSSINQRIFILSQIILLIIIVFAVIIIIKRVGSRNSLSKKDYLMGNGNKRSRTDLDILYEMLEKEKEIGMENVENTFHVKPDIALEWFKVLENGELAEINYPRFGKPVLRLIKEEGKTEEIVLDEKAKITIKKSIGKKVKVGKKKSASRGSRRQMISNKKSKTVKKRVVKKTIKRVVKRAVKKKHKPKKKVAKKKR